MTNITYRCEECPNPCTLIIEYENSDGRDPLMPDGCVLTTMKYGEWRKIS